MKGFTYRERVGDLFDAPATSSLAHCVAADLKMGAGIAVSFKERFGEVSFLKKQEKTSPFLRVLPQKDRFIYYLVTKRRSFEKPTYISLEESLFALKAHIVENKVRDLSIPRIGCGLDRLNWKEVRKAILEIFKGVDIAITVYVIKPDFSFK